MKIIVHVNFHTDILIDFNMGKIGRRKPLSSLFITILIAVDQSEARIRDILIDFNMG